MSEDVFGGRAVRAALCGRPRPLQPLGVIGRLREAGRSAAPRISEHITQISRRIGVLLC
jgi:hypothetical protein